MAENSTLKTALIVGAVGVGAYFLFKDRLQNAFDNAKIDAGSSVLDIFGTSGVLPGGSLIKGDVLMATPTIIEDIKTSLPVQQAQNYATSVKSGTNKAVKQIAGDDASYKGYSGVLTINKQGYSVAAEKAPVMAAQIVATTNKQNLKAATTTYGAVANPYAKFTK